jgi:cold shock CspA family protein
MMLPITHRWIETPGSASISLLAKAGTERRPLMLFRSIARHNICFAARLLKSVESRGFGFIRHGHESVFFHVEDILKVDGQSVVPCIGCVVSFFLGQKKNQQIAAQIWIEQWPQELTIEEQFAAAEDLPLDVPQPVVVPQSVLAPATRHLSLIEIMNMNRQERKGIQND